MTHGKDSFTRTLDERSKREVIPLIEELDDSPSPATRILEQLRWAKHFFSQFVEHFSASQAHGSPTIGLEIAFKVPWNQSNDISLNLVHLAIDNSPFFSSEYQKHLPHLHPFLFDAHSSITGLCDPTQQTIHKLARTKDKPIILNLENTLVVPWITSPLDLQELSCLSIGDNHPGPPLFLPSNNPFDFGYLGPTFPIVIRTSLSNVVRMIHMLEFVILKVDSCPRVLQISAHVHREIDQVHAKDHTPILQFRAVHELLCTVVFVRIMIRKIPTIKRFIACSIQISPGFSHVGNPVSPFTHTSPLPPPMDPDNKAMTNAKDRMMQSLSYNNYYGSFLYHLLHYNNNSFQKGKMNRLRFGALSCKRPSRLQ